MSNLIVGCTGHRPQKIPNYNYDSLYDLATKALETLKPDKVISGMALGWDTAMAQTALNLNIPVEAAIPFRGQETKWSTKDKQLYLNMLDSCDVVYVDELEQYNPGNSKGYAVWKLYERNKYIVDRLYKLNLLYGIEATKLLAYYDETKSISGSTSCVNYAVKKGITVINYWS